MLDTLVRAAAQDPAAIRSRLSGKSLWVLRYTDGRLIPEWQCDWTLAPSKGRQAVRLYCPSGDIAQLGGTTDASGRLFQFKCAYTSAGGPSGTDAHVIGFIENTNGDCICAAWQYDTKTLVRFRDNVHAFRYKNVGAVHADHVGIKPD